MSKVSPYMLLVFSFRFKTVATSIDKAPLTAMTRVTPAMRKLMVGSAVAIETLE